MPSNGDSTELRFGAPAPSPGIESILGPAVRRLAPVGARNR
ncbi:MAG: hypothetical protein OXG81_09115 [Acidobacteria bacterium]|nr:hypothetical protein [Acidobacteriota bacterium]